MTEIKLTDKEKEIISEAVANEQTYKTVEQILNARLEHAEELLQEYRDSNYSLIAGKQTAVKEITRLVTKLAEKKCNHELLDVDKVAEVIDKMVIFKNMYMSGFDSKDIAAAICAIFPAPDLNEAKLMALKQNQENIPPEEAWLCEHSARIEAEEELKSLKQRIDGITVEEILKLINAVRYIDNTAFGVGEYITAARFLELAHNIVDKIHDKIKGVKK